MSASKFKVGDVVIHKGSRKDGLTLGKEYKVIKVHSPDDDNDYLITLINDADEMMEYFNYRFQLVKKEYKPCVNDIEWLDRVQSNFKE